MATWFVRLMARARAYVQVCDRPVTQPAGAVGFGKLRLKLG